MKVPKMLLGMFGLGLAMLAPSAKADTVDVFAVSAGLLDGTTASGDVTIDLTSGVITAASLEYLGQSYAQILGQGAFTGQTASGQTPVSADYGIEVGVTRHRF